jgi:hypothetical protein
MYWLGERLGSAYVERDGPGHRPSTGGSTATIGSVGGGRYDLGRDAGDYRFLTVTTSHERLDAYYCVDAHQRCAEVLATAAGAIPTACTGRRVLAFEHPERRVTVAVVAAHYAFSLPGCETKPPPPLPATLSTIGRLISKVPPQPPEPAF